MIAMDDLSFESTRAVLPEEFVEFVRRRAGWDPSRYELLHGRIVMTPPAGWPHGSIEASLVQRLCNYVVARGLGHVLGSSQGFQLPTGEIVEPDVTFVSVARWAAAPPPEEGAFLRVVPDLVVEILSPSTGARDRGEKRALYARSGVAEYWLVDPRARAVTVLVRGEQGYDQERTFAGRDPIASTLLTDLALSAADLLP